VQQPLLLRLHLFSRGLPLVLSLLCLVGVSAGQTFRPAVQPNDATLKLDTFDDRDPLLPGLSAASGEPGVMALPDLPVPHLLLDTQLVDTQIVAAKPLPFQDPLQQRDPAPQASASDSPPEPGTSIADQNAEFGNMSINGVDVVEAWGTFQGMMPHAPSLNASEVPIVDPSAPGYSIEAGPYHWSGLFAQSLMFNVFENTFRAFSDVQMQVQLAKKPFWHDWLASTKQFNMHRWNDGDDFLVNYIGHPLQGSVSDFIEIQNDPRGRQLEIGADPAYWKSRFNAFLWSVVYSTHSEISNEGGFTYPIHCRTPGCPQWNIHKMHATNNTGWVDFTITPTVGFLWMLAEDAADRFISDRLQGGDRFNLGFAFLRAGLNPSRSFANAMRFKSPWYRDFQHDPELENSLMVHPLPSDEDIAEAGRFRRFAIAPFLHTMPIGSPNQPCIFCFSSPGLGIDLDYAINHWLSATFSFSSQSGLWQKGTTATGSTLNVGYGLRFVHEGREDSMSLVVRPGIVTDEIVKPMRLDVLHNTYYHPVVDVENTAVTLMMTYDHKITKTVAIRSSVGDTIVRYKSPIEDPPGIGKLPFLSWLSHDEYTNKSNWIAETGPVIRF
jgi:hypothetical protein